MPLNIKLHTRPVDKHLCVDALNEHRDMHWVHKTDEEKTNSLKMQHTIPVILYNL